MEAGSRHGVERIAVVGGGACGAGVAQVLALTGYRVGLHAADLEGARAEVDGGRFGLLALADAGRISRAERSEALARLDCCAEVAQALAEADLVIATPDGVTPAAEQLAPLEAAAATEAVVACNTGSEPLASLATGARRPERLVVWRWGRPAQTSRLAEIVRGDQTDAAVVETVIAVARRAGKNPVVVTDDPAAQGCVTNRVWAAMRAEADRIVAAGVATPAQVDRLITDGFGWPRGPFGHGPEP